MKVILLCKNDWANISYILQQCLLKIGVDVLAFKKNKHHYNYPNQIPLFPKGDLLKKCVTEADVVIFVHSQLINTGINLKNKKVYVMHTGSGYRQNSKKINSIFNPIVTATLSGGDVLGMGAKNEIWIQPPIDTEGIQPVYKNPENKKIVIGHYPSGPYKGTEKIISVINELKNKYNFDFIYDLKTVPWNDQIKRMSKCDIYIENMMEFQENIPLKIFGMTTLEVSCLGKVPLMRFPLFDKYEKEFGKCGIQVVNNLNELKVKLKQLLEMDVNEIIKLQKQARSWVENCHSYEVIGRRYKQIFER